MDFLAILSNSASEILSPTTAAFALATIGLNVHFGYSGLLNFGQAGFMAIGAYTTALLLDDREASTPLPLVVLAAVVVTLVVGIAVGAVQGYVYCRSEYPDSIRVLEAAIGKARQAGILGRAWHAIRLWIK